MRKFILFIIFLFFNFQNLKPIKDENVKWVSLISGLSVGSIASLITYSNTNKQNARGNSRLLKSLAIGGGVGSIAAYLAYKIALDNTPIGKFNSAGKTLERTYSKYIVAKKFESQELFLSYIISHYYSNWPLVDARQDLEFIKLDLISAKWLLDSACKETIEYNKDLWICSESKKIVKQIDDFLDRIAARISTVISCQLYKEQYKRYKKYQKKIEKITQSVVDGIQKEQDRKRKENLVHDIISQTHGNVGININI